MSGAIPLLPLYALPLPLGYEAGVLAARTVLCITKRKEPTELMSEERHRMTFCTFLSVSKASTCVSITVVVLAALIRTYLSHLIFFDG